MAFNLKNRSFLKEIDFEPRELGYLLKLSEALKLAKYAGTEVKHLEGKEIALIFEKTSTRIPVRVRGRGLRPGRARDLPRPVRLPARPQGIHRRHRRRAGPDVRRDRVPRQQPGRRRRAAAHAGVPVYNGLTNEWHPTQMLADFLTMHEASGKPYHALTYAFVGDCRFNMGRSLLIMGALMGSDVRLSGPAELQPPKDVVTSPMTSQGGPARGSPSPTIPAQPSRELTSSTPTCGSPWARPRTSGPAGSSS